MSTDARSLSLPARSEYSQHWALRPDIVFLNHGSFGACPTAVLDEQTRLRHLLEQDPTEFFLTEAPQLWASALESLAKFLNADPNGLAFVPNSTTGVNTVLRSLKLEPGDEILVPDHAYQACRNAIEYVCAESGASPVVIELPFALSGPDDVLERIVAGVTARTRLALIDTVSSPTAIRMPFEALTAELQGRGVDVLLDCSHGPGAVPLDLSTLGAAYATGNCHKWLCTPKGSAFLHVREDRLADIRPLPISHGYAPNLQPAQRFRSEFDWQGTQDVTPWLSIPFAIDYLGNMVADGWSAIIARNHDLAVNARQRICEALEQPAAMPDDMLACTATVRLGAINEDEAVDVFDKDALWQSLYDDYRIQLIVFDWPAHRSRYLRVSAALYNSIAEYDYLAVCLRKLIRRP